MKKVLLAIMVICLGLAGSVSAIEPLANDLAGYWPLDGNGADASVYGNDGVIMGDPVIIGNVADANAMVGQALGFNGANFVKIANAAQYDITDHCTMSLWFRVDDPGFNQEWQTAFGRGDWSWRIARNGND
ncbi:MAG: hypothetical protein J7M14_00195, partial [Planctomycetes bacterium]|nr:hypothetical protein [Planctomycetota bacterium]